MSTPIRLGDLHTYLASDVAKLSHVWMMAPQKDKDAILREASQDRSLTLDL